MKDAGMRIRVELDLRDEFTEACKKRHVPAAQVIRHLMRDYVEQCKLNTNKLRVDTKNKKVAS